MVEATVRNARPEEADDLGALALRSKAVWGYDAAFLEACRDELRVPASRIGRGGVLVAELAGERAGFVAVGGTPPYGELEMLFVEPDRLRRGLGVLLLGAGLAWAAEQGHEHLELEADPGAESFYVAAGAVRVGEVPSGSIPGRVLPRLRIACRR